MSAHHQTVWDKAWPFSLLCLTASTIWLLLDRFHQIAFTLATNATAAAIALALTLAMAARTPRPALPQAARLALAGALLIAGPSIAIFLHATFLGQAGLAIALTLTPVVVAVADSVLGSTELSADSLWPGLTAAVALLIAIPAPSLSDWRGDLALALAPILTGIGCVLFHTTAAPTPWKAPSAAAGATLAFAAAALMEGATLHTFPQFSLPAIAIDAVLFTLALLALTRLNSSQYTARYAIVPFLILIQGPLLLHAWFTWRSAACAVLLLAAAVALLRSKSPQQDYEEALEQPGFRG